MNVAIKLASGRGTRMNQDVPKQFITVFDKPIIIYTLESFQNHPEIDEIEVVCLEGWHEILHAYADQFDISKLRWVVSGGNTVQESIFNGVMNLEGKYQDSDNIIIHDGIRPLVDSFVLSDVIDKCDKFGNAASSLPYNEQIFRTNDGTTSREFIPRELLRRVSTPQAYKFKKLLWAYKEAFSKGIGIHGSSYANTLMVDLGETLHLAKGSEKNIKLTTQEDLIAFKAYINTYQNNIHEENSILD